MINKTDIPKIKYIDKPIFNKPEIRFLSNNIPVYALKVGKADLVRIDFLFDAGSVFDVNPLTADTVNSLIDAGTKNHTSEIIAEELDFYGAYLEKYSGHHKSKIVLYTLNKYIEQTLRILSDIIYNAVFPENELEIFIQNRYQEYLINRRKTEVISNEIFIETLYGKSHPYGRIPNEKDFKNVNGNDIRDFYRKYYTENTFKIIISGNVTEHHFELTETLFGSRKLNEIQNNQHNYKMDTSTQIKKFEHIEDTVQTSIKIGKVTLNKKNPDYFNLNFTSILLGGYFGSRLMKNIREDKGYTYGIYASITSMLQSGFFSISAETGNHVYEKATEEIYKELKSLRLKPVPEEELIRVKNKITGNMLKAFDGPFTLSETLSSLIDYNLNFDYHHSYFESIARITPEIIMETAEKYLNENSMYEVIVGCK